MTRIESEPGIFHACEPQPWSMDARRRILDQISDPVAQKILIVRWGMRGEIEPADAELLIRERGLESA